MQTKYIIKIDLNFYSVNKNKKNYISYRNKLYRPYVNLQVCYATMYLLTWKNLHIVNAK